MDKLVDYIKWVGSLDFEKYPFREADALVLCVISYFDLNPVFDPDKHELPAPRVKDCLGMIEKGEARLCITGGDMGNTEIFEAAAKSVRFGNLFMTDYMDILRQDPALQYASVTFHDDLSENGKFSFIAYRGTDNTIAGWKEDFMISFTRTQAQQMAASYAEEIIMKKEYAGQDRKWYIAGHSKGGNQALYAACSLSAKAWDKVERVYLLDGPGLCREVMDLSLVDRIDPKTTRIIPEFDIIGKLFEPKITDTRIIHSSRKGLEQHSLASWMVDHGDLSDVERNDPRARWINESFDAWIENIAPADRQIFIDEFFGSMLEGGMDNLDEMKPDTLRAAILNFRGKSETSKKTLNELTGRAIFGEDLDQLKTSDKRFKGIWNWIRYSRLAHSIALIAGGIAILLMSDSILDVVAFLLVVSIALLQTVLTFRFLKRNHWDLEAGKDRMLLMIILIALVVILIIKEDAMFLLGSLIAGVLFMIGSYSTGIKAFRQRHRPFYRTLYILECIFCAIFGLSFLVIPRATVYAYSLSIGTCAFADGLIRLVYILVKHLTARETI